MTTHTTPDNKDPFFFDHEALQEIADRSAINQGLIFFKENRVIDLDRDDTVIWAQVEDEARSDFPLDMDLRAFLAIARLRFIPKSNGPQIPARRPGKKRRLREKKNSSTAVFHLYQD